MTGSVPSTGRAPWRRPASGWPARSSGCRRPAPASRHARRPNARPIARGYRPSCRCSAPGGDTRSPARVGARAGRRRPPPPARHRRRCGCPTGYRGSSGARRGPASTAPAWRRRCRTRPKPPPRGPGSAAPRRAVRSAPSPRAACGTSRPPPPAPWQRSARSRRSPHRSAVSARLRPRSCHPSRTTTGTPIAAESCPPPPAGTSPSARTPHRHRRRLPGPRYRGTAAPGSGAGAPAAHGGAWRSPELSSSCRAGPSVKPDFRYRCAVAEKLHPQFHRVVLTGIERERDARASGFRVALDYTLRRLRPT